MKKFLILLILLFNFMVEMTPGKSYIDSRMKQQDVELFKRLNEMKMVYNLKTINIVKLDSFLNDIGLRESNNNTKAVNSYGYIGRFQFGKAALKDVGYGHVDIKEFKSNPNIFTPIEQKDAMIKYMKLNKRRLNKVIKRYNNTVINGIKITESGILAASHLAGAGGVKRFLKSNGKYNPYDGYGTELSDYLKKFSQYNFNLDLI